MEGNPIEGNAIDGNAIDGSTRGGSARDGRTIDGLATDGNAIDGSTTEGGVTDGFAIDGSASDGSTRDGSARDGWLEGRPTETPVADAGRHAAAGCVTVTVEKTVTFAPTPRFKSRSWGFGHAKTAVARVEVVKMESFILILFLLEC